MRYLIFIFFLSSFIYGQNGIIKTYYPDGTPRTETSYVNDILDGDKIMYYPNGNIMYEKYFSNGILSGTIKEFYDTGLLKEEYTVNDGLIDGIQRYFYPNGSLKSVAVYNRGQRSQINTFEYDPNHVALPEDYQAGNRQQELLKKKKQEVICDVDICPFPIGGLKTVYDNLVYPEHALLYGLEGTVILVATINKKGDVVNTEVIKHLGLGCDEAAQNAVKKTKFIPGQKMNKIVESHVTLNIDFKIVDRSFVKNGTDLAKAKDMLNKTIQNTTAENKVNVENDKETVEQNKPIAELKSELKQTIEIKCDNVDECPSPENGKESIYKNLVVPFIAKRLKLKGEIIIEANIDKYGITRDTKVISGIGYGCDDAVESALMRTKFYPAKKSGIEVDSKITVYFPFSYEE